MNIYNAYNESRMVLWRWNAAKAFCGWMNIAPAKGTKSEILLFFMILTMLDQIYADQTRATMRKALVPDYYMLFGHYNTISAPLWESESHF